MGRRSPLTIVAIVARDEHGQLPRRARRPRRRRLRDLGALVLRDRPLARPARRGDPDRDRLRRAASASCATTSIRRGSSWATPARCCSASRSPPVSVQGLLKTAALATLVLPLLVLAVPLLDTSFVVARRIKHGQPIYVADRAAPAPPLREHRLLAAPRRRLPLRLVRDPRARRARDALRPPAPARPLGRVERRDRRRRRRCSRSARRSTSSTCSRSSSSRTRSSAAARSSAPSARTPSARSGRSHDLRQSRRDLRSVKRLALSRSPVRCRIAALCSAPMEPVAPPCVSACRGRRAARSSSPSLVIGAGTLDRLGSPARSKAGPDRRRRPRRARPASPASTAATAEYFS